MTTAPEVTSGTGGMTMTEALEALRAGEVVDRTPVYINGRWETSDSDGLIAVGNPATEQFSPSWPRGAAPGSERR